MYSPATRAFFRTATLYTFGIIGFGLALRLVHFETPRSATLLATMLALACSVPLAMNALRSTALEAPVHGARLMAIGGALFGACIASAMVTQSKAMVFIGMLTVLPYLVGGMTKRVEKHVKPAYLIGVGVAQAILVPLFLGYG
jgi:hypothetical protein